MLLAPTPSLNGIAVPYSGGLSGVRQTIRVMRRYVNAARIDPAFRQKATSIIFLAPAKDEPTEVRRIFEFVQSTIRYTRDVNGVETLTTPQKTLEGRIGDCDDMSALFAALCEAVGYPTRFVVSGYSDPGVCEHVYVQVSIGDDWIDADCTEAHPLGWSPPDPVTLYTESV